MKSIKILAIFLMILFTELSGADVTPTQVYIEALKVKGEIESIKKHFHISTEVKSRYIKGRVAPRHAWQKSYEIFVKLNILRRKLQLPIVEPVNIEPTASLEPILTYEQIKRLFTEVQIIKFHIGISEEVEQNLSAVKDKEPKDVYNLLSTISRHLDLINGSEFTPSYVFGEVIRINEDINIILRHLKIQDKTTPPKKVIGATPYESFQRAIKLMKEIRNFQIHSAIDTVDITPFMRDSASPSDVFEISQIILAELQVIKAHLGLNHEVTRGAFFFQNRLAEDVHQMLGWLIKKFRLINRIHYSGSI